MRVAIVRNAYMGGFGGAESFPVNLAVELKKLGHNPILLSGHKVLLKSAKSVGVESLKTPWLSSRDWHGWKTVLLPVYVLWQIYLYFRYLLIFNKTGIQCAHLQSRDDFIAGTFAAKTLGLMTVWTDHADLKYEFQNVHILHKNFLGKLILLSARYSDVITVVSNNDKREINKHLNGKLDEKIKVIHNGVRDSFTEINAVDRPKDKFIVGTTSRILKTKGIEELIRGFESANIPHSELWLVGDGQDMQYMKDLTTSNDVRFLGHKDNPLAYTKSFDVFVQSSYMEGFSVALVEAAMLKRPIIATDVGGNSELIVHKRNGLLIPPGDSQALAASIKQLYSSPKATNRYAAAARKHYEDKLNFSTVVKNVFIPIYRGES